jgi:hypothetical protein
MDQDLDQLLGRTDPAVKGLTQRALERALEIVPDAMVTIDKADIGVGTGPGYKHLVFVITPRKGYVTLGVARGAELPDPGGLMEGRGKVHRHVKLRNHEELDAPALRDLMAAAAARGTRPA